MERYLRDYNSLGMTEALVVGRGERHDHYTDNAVRDGAGPPTRFRPPSFAVYNRSSAARNNASEAVPSSGYIAAPMLTVTCAPSEGAGIASIDTRIRSAMAASAGGSSWGRITANSSPPYLAGKSTVRTASRMARATRCSASLPDRWP